MAYINKKKGTIYVDGNERPTVVDCSNNFWDMWFNKYFPHMSYFEGVDMKMVEPEFNADKMEIVSVFNYTNIFRVNEYQRLCWLGNYMQVIKPRSAGRGLMVSEFVCP